MSDADIKAIADEMIRRYPENLNSISIEGRGFMLGATWGLERGTARFIQTRASFHELNGRLMSDNIAKNKRIEELETEIVTLKENSNDEYQNHSPFGESDSSPKIMNSTRIQPQQKPEDDIIPEDYYIK